jgi:hypothetical protein
MKIEKKLILFSSYLHLHTEIMMDLTAERRELHSEIFKEILNISEWSLDFFNYCGIIF